MSDNMELLEKAMDIIERQAQVMTSMHERTLVLTETNVKLTEALNAVTDELERLTKAYQMDVYGLDPEPIEKTAMLASFGVENSKPKFPRYITEEGDPWHTESWDRVLDRTVEDFYNDEDAIVGLFQTMDMAKKWVQDNQEWLDYDPTIR